MARFHQKPFCRLFAFLLLLPLGCHRPAGAEPPVPFETRAGGVYLFPAAFLLSDVTPLTHTFLLRNGTKKALTIERIAASCECITAKIGGRARLPITVPLGAVVPVVVRLSPRRLLPGRFSKSVWLYWPGGNRDGLRLELRGTVRDAETPTGAASVSAVH